MPSIERDLRMWRAAAYCVLVAPLLASPNHARAQSVVLDQGSFAISVHGEPSGTEQFTIRRAGFGNDAVLIADGTVTGSGSESTEETRTLLRAALPEGAAAGYEAKVSGSAPMEIRMNLVGPRFDSRFLSPEGEEQREFRARPGTRVVERGVAHHMYFLRSVREGERVPVIEPRSREAGEVVAGAWEDVELRLGRNDVEARRVAFTTPRGERVVWYDRQGRVLRVEVASEGYVAVREDLVG